MKIRIEFGESKSKAFPWVLRLCRRLKSYAETVEDGIAIHSLELDFKREWHTFEVISHRISGWANTAFYLDGALISAWQIEGIRMQAMNAGSEQNDDAHDFGTPERGIIDIDREHVEGEKN